MADDIQISFDDGIVDDFQNIELEASKHDAGLGSLDERDEEEEDKAPQQVASMGASSGFDSSRRNTDPVTPLSAHIHLKPMAVPMGRSRTRSPYSRSHLRSKSNTALGHPMTRAFSNPLSESVPELNPSSHQTLHAQTFHTRPESPMGTPYGRRASPRRQLDEPFIYNPIEVATPSVPTIEENEELSLPPPSPSIPEDGMPPPSSPFFSSHSAFSRPSRRRPSSPLYSVAPRTSSPGARILHTSSSVPTLSMSHISGPMSSQGPTTPTSMALASPTSKYNESYPLSPAPPSNSMAMSSASSMYSMSMGSSIYSGSSMPSTPTSVRSRSPSISSLDTIPDSPDAEAEAIEQERIDRLERLDRMEKLRSLMGNRDSEEVVRRPLSGSAGKERKRWSVCGAERRGDLEMETIWED